MERHRARISKGRDGGIEWMDKTKARQKCSTGKTQTCGHTPESGHIMPWQDFQRAWVSLSLSVALPFEFHMTGNSLSFCSIHFKLLASPSAIATCPHRFTHHSQRPPTAAASLLYSLVPQSLLTLNLSGSLINSLRVPEKQKQSKTKKKQHHMDDAVVCYQLELSWTIDAVAFLGKWTRKNASLDTLCTHNSRSLFSEASNELKPLHHRSWDALKVFSLVSWTSYFCTAVTLYPIQTTSVLTRFWWVWFMVAWPHELDRISWWWLYEA